MNQWKEIVQYLMKSEECKEVHKMASLSEGWIYVTDRYGTRYKVTKDWTMVEVEKLVKNIKKENG